jgi:uncharacterized membrane protein YhhN
MKTAITGSIYFLAGVLFIISFYNDTFLSPLFLKASLMPIILLILILNLNISENRFHVMMAAAIIFSCAGDILLQLNRPGVDLFIPGLGSFLLAQLMYLVVFFMMPGKNNFLLHKWYLLIPVAAYGMLLILFLYNSLGEMKLPVIIYASVILLMLSAAINRFFKTDRSSYFLVLSGAVLFVLSDSLIAVDKFNTHFESSTVVIMSAYIIAQFLIAAGYIRQYRKDFA